MFSALSEMSQEDLIIWPKSLPSNGKVEIDGKLVTLTLEETKSLLEIDLMKEEIWMMRKTKTEAGNIRYALQADKQRTAHKRNHCAQISIIHKLILENPI